MKKFLVFTSSLIMSLCCLAQPIGQVTQGLAATEGEIWPEATCEVCWENPSDGNQTERDWVRDAVASTWERESNFRFTGWETCNSGSQGIRIQIEDIGPHTKALGKSLNGKEHGMVLNFTFNNWTGCDNNDPDCGCRNSAEGRENCIRSIAVHEFGHALGFAHEQNRSDAPLWCQEDAQGTTGNWWITPYDAESIMNYCSSVWNNNGQLSDLDISGVRTLYGGSPLSIPTIYAVMGSGNLRWYRHTGFLVGTPDWAPGSFGTVSHGWNSLSHVFSDGRGYLYGVKSNGELVWYNHNGFQTGSADWAQGSGKTIGYGWATDTKAVFSGGEGIIYLLKNNGDLFWYRHLGYRDGKEEWAANSGVKVGSGWNDYICVFSGGRGVIYTVGRNGDLYWYKHAGFASGTNEWYGGQSNKVSSGWNLGHQIYSTGWGQIYMVDASGQLKYYKHLGFNNGTATWGTGTGNIVGSGWAGVKTIGMGSHRSKVTKVDMIRVTPSVFGN